MLKLSTTFLLVTCFYVNSTTRSITVEPTVAQVPNTSQISVSIKNTATSSVGDKYISIIGGYSLSCPVSNADTKNHLVKENGEATSGNVLEYMIMGYGHRTDGAGSYIAGYPMTKAWEKVLQTNKEIECKIEIKTEAFFANDQISISFSGAGFGFTITSSNANMSDSEIISLPVILKPQEPTGSGDPCLVYCVEFDPLLIDLNQDGIHLGEKDKGVYFDMLDTGFPSLMQWVAKDGDEAFLAYDIDGNGVIDNGTELFGNGTLIHIVNNSNPQIAIQPQDYASNGFVALSQFDRPELGGNDDGQITSADSIWYGLSLWLDSNADGISTANEILTLEQASITNLDIIPKQNNRYDHAGNRLPLWSWASGNAKFSNDKHKMVDVFFKGL